MVVLSVFAIWSGLVVAPANAATAQPELRTKTPARKATLSLAVTRANNGNKPTVRVRTNAQRVKVTAWNTSGKRVGTKIIRIKKTKTFKLAWNRVTKIQATTVRVTVGKGKKRTRLTVNKKTRTIKVRATKPSKPSKPVVKPDGITPSAPTVKFTQFSYHLLKFTVSNVTRPKNTHDCYVQIQARVNGGVWGDPEDVNSSSAECKTSTLQYPITNKPGKHEIRARVIAVNYNNPGPNGDYEFPSTWSPINTHNQPTWAAFLTMLAPHSQTALLNAHNTARATGRYCGSTWMPAASPLTLNSKLTQAANIHAQDMVTNNFFDHKGSDNSTPTIRAQRAGYTGTAIGENLASISIFQTFPGSSLTAVLPTLASNHADTQMTSWFNSPGHCQNLMNANHRHVGFSVNHTHPRVAVFGRP